LLRTLIRRYIVDGQPVGSRTLSRESSLDLSAATIRNVMADLEDLGLVRAPHTSAGRVPTQLGYRVFVDTMLKVKQLDRAALAEIEDVLNADRDPQVLVSSASELLSQVTRYAGLITIPGSRHSNLRQIEFLSLASRRVLAILVTDDGRVQNRVLSMDRDYRPGELVEAANYFNASHAGTSLHRVREALLADMKVDSAEMNRIMTTAVQIAKGLFSDEDSDEVLVSGETNLMGVPEFAELKKLRDIFDAFKTKQDLLDLLDKSLRTSGVSIFIGEESGYDALTECSVVTAPYEVDGQCIGVLGVVGPTRMAYDEIIPVVDVTARLLGHALAASQG
jgi:heat-inducible transcriptional repressor